MRSRAVLSALFVTLFVTSVVPCFAQGGFGLGGRMSMIKADAQSEDDAVRFWGGQIRARTSLHTALELSMDVHTDSNESETIKVRDLPIQASLLLFPMAGSFSPYVLGGAGWYYRRVELLAGDETLNSETTHEFGWHMGVGAELRAGRHFGLHGDYRYTNLHWKEEVGDSSVKRFLPRYNGSMWTAGLTLYF
jgi:opacity protein-like surface antigen